MVPEHIEPMLRKAIDEARAEGWEIVQGVTRDPQSMCCCAIGALVPDVGGIAAIKAAKKTLGITEYQCRVIIWGFDGRDMGKVTPEERPFYDLGRRLWAYAEATR